ncbi:LITAF domain-containing protein-like [Montipora capricornis]|uniref:LITAF domain-containing protein-like n=1 Tax=Montipora foliosa TaxID=591990 RepID=UPI0035F173D3
MADKPPPPPYPAQQHPGVYPQPGYNPQQPAYSSQQPGYPPQPAPYGNQPGYTSTTTIIHQPTAVLAMANFHEIPVPMTCPNCRATIVTSTDYVTGTLTWLACLGLCVVGCDAGCCLIPFCVDSMKDVIHTCPSCGTQVGVYRRM